MSLVTLTFASWNQLGEWLRRVEALRQFGMSACAFTQF
jgi:hypothetical protein